MHPGRCYKWCFVPMCTNTSVKTPDKRFLSVPRKESRRKQWMLAARRKNNKSKSSMYCCEDHFDIENDVTNYMYLKICEPQSRHRVQLKPDAIPTRFDCQTSHLMTAAARKTLPNGNLSRSAIDSSGRVVAPLTIKVESDFSQTEDHGYDWSQPAEERIFGAEIESSDQGVAPATIKLESVDIQNDDYQLSDWKSATSGSILPDPARSAQEGVVVDRKYTLEVTQVTIKLEREDFELDVYECFKCATQFNRKNQLAEHIRVCHNVAIKPDSKRTWMCANCGKICTTRRGLIYHLTTHTGVHAYSCSMCQRRFTRSSNLAKHKAIYGASRHYSCHLCRLVFKQEAAFQEHARLAHINHSLKAANAYVSSGVSNSILLYAPSNLASSSHPCYKCDKQFNQEIELINHIWSYHDIPIGPDGNRRWKCEQCEKTYTCPRDLVRHQRSHTGERFYSCAICPKRFTKPSHLTRHQEVHRTDRPFTCIVCWRGFKRKSNLRQHERLFHKYNSSSVAPSDSGESAKKYLKHCAVVHNEARDNVIHVEKL